MKDLNEFDPCPPSEAPLGSARETSPAYNCVALYLRDICRAKLLTREEEIELAGRIKKGDREAREQLIKSNLRLVVRIARAYEGLGLPLLDLISEGNIGLLRAVDRFDPYKGAKFSAYSAFWIRQAITQALASQSKTIRLPVHVVSKLSKMHRAASRLEDTLGREPTDDELAAEVGTTPRRIIQMRVAAIRPASLDAQFDGEEIGSYADTVADEKAELPYDTLDGMARTLMVRDVVQTLDQREQAILRLRFGLNEELPKTLDEVGEELGLSSERVRQVQNAALKKVRCRIKNLELQSLSPAQLRSGKCQLRL
ncbi:MAG TPA: RNA polymerase sigma factor RpoD/SigA [Verrucomicrobiae bacterium]